MFEPIRFLEDLSRNNDREWFQANHVRYEQAKQQVIDLVQRLILEISEFDPSVKGIRPQDCLYRIHRDLRFSKDKTPYKTHWGAYISKGGRQGLHCGYYLHITPGGSFLAGGTYGLTPKQMREVKLSILDGMDEFTAIVEDEAFKATYPDIFRESLSRLPSYIPKDTAHPEYFLAKAYFLKRDYKDGFFSKRDATGILATDCRTMKPILDFLNYTIDDF